MHKDLERALEQFEANEKLYEKIITKHRARLNDRPAKGGWSIAECVEHVNTVARELVGPLKQTIHEAKAAGKMSDRPHRPGFVGKYMTRSMEPPAKKKMKTQKLYEPKSNLDPDTLLEQYKDVHNTFKQLIREADGVDLSKVKMRSPALKIMKLNIGDWLFFTASHERRHAWQAEQVAKGLK
jgi:hypothetical protein